MTTQPLTPEQFAVHKYSHAVPAAQAPCGTCGHTVRYNLAVGLVVRADTDGVCDEPWPYEPRPGWVRAAIRRGEQLVRDLARVEATLAEGEPR